MNPIDDLGGHPRAAIELLDQSLGIGHIGRQDGNRECRSAERGLVVHDGIRHLNIRGVVIEAGTH